MFIEVDRVVGYARIVARTLESFNGLGAIHTSNAPVRLFLNEPW